MDKSNDVPKALCQLPEQFKAQSHYPTSNKKINR